jgi:predicted NAD/FAD-binding protein
MVQMLVQFWVNHHLLSLLERPLWRVVSGRSRTYVNAVLAAMPGRVRVNSEVSQP